jgi:predicted O-methyltransferase YrrM
MTKDYINDIMICKNELDLFLEIFSNPNSDVLEWGSGYSTIEIARRVKSVVSIESEENWFYLVNNKLSEEKLSNTELFHVPISRYLINNGEGNLEQCRSYVDKPKELNKMFDIIFIDGRARVECARVAKTLLKPNGLVIVHDYPVRPSSDRQSYREIENFLKPIKNANMLKVFSMYGENEEITKINVNPIDEHWRVAETLEDKMTTKELEIKGKTI